jgi:hypothetical protein
MQSTLNGVGPLTVLALGRDEARQLPLCRGLSSFSFSLFPESRHSALVGCASPRPVTRTETFPPGHSLVP